MVSAAQVDGTLPLGAMLYGLQLRCREGDAPWRAMEPALNRLAELIAPDDPLDVITVAGDDWWIEVGPVDLGGEIVTFQRDDVLIAAMVGRDDGRLRIAAFRPLDAQCAHELIELSGVAEPDNAHGQQASNWTYAIHRSKGIYNVYAARDGRSHLSYWSDGLGITDDGAIIPEWHAQRSLVPRQAAHVVAELGTYYQLSDQ